MKVPDNCPDFTRKSVKWVNESTEKEKCER
jgi:hypothetical protein